MKMTLKEQKKLSNQKIEILKIIILIILVISILIAGNIGNLIGYIIESCAIFGFGLYILIKFIHHHKKDIKSILMYIVVCGIILLIGSINLIKASLDIIQGPVSIPLTNCTVTTTQTIRGFYHTYYLKGENYSIKDNKFQIDRHTYYQLYDKYNINIELIYWKHSKITKNITIQSYQEKPY